jgi:hypothetical protein
MGPGTGSKLSRKSSPVLELENWSEPYGGLLSSIRKPCLCHSPQPQPPSPHSPPAYCPAHSCSSKPAHLTRGCVSVLNRNLCLSFPVPTVQSAVSRALSPPDTLHALLFGSLAALNVLKLTMEASLASNSEICLYLPLEC